MTLGVGLGFVLPIPTVPEGLENLGPRGGTHPAGDRARIPSMFSVASFHPSDSLCQETNRQRKESLPGRASDPGPLERIGLLLHSRARKKHAWHAGDAPGCLLVLPCPILIVSEQIQKPALRRGW